MRKVATRMVLLVAIGALLVAAAAQPALAKRAAQVRKAPCAAHAHLYACGSKRGGWCCRSRRPASEESERLFECLLSQPFVICD